MYGIVISWYNGLSTEVLILAIIYLLFLLLFIFVYRKKLKSYEYEVIDRWDTTGLVTISFLHPVKTIRIKDKIIKLKHPRKNHWSNRVGLDEQEKQKQETKEN